MRILDDVADFESSAAPLILAIGNFDGLHAGHQQLLEKVVRRARAKNGTSAVLTFRQHPQHILHPSSKPPLLTSVNHKLALFERLGLDLCFLIPFTPDFSRMEPEDFVEQWLYGMLKVQELYLGYNARFGRERKGDSNMMKTLSARHGFYYEEQVPVSTGGGLVSSSRIRALIHEGRLEEAQICLARPFSILAKVVRGAGRGAKIGFPTANFEIENEIMPPFGVYPVILNRVEIRKETEPGGKGTGFSSTLGPRLQGILNYGYRPTFQESQTEAVPEVFIFDFSETIYGQTFEISFYPRIRGETAFSSAAALKTQISQDIEQARRLFQGMAEA